ncbi:BLUF domain-containing protein [Magnetospira sp. QH-2]|uniref:BLUF domain-containing protein n=1 Tax=Magnetospira sp. (strain QH-2) TaxID=1288970 RepID=UPI0003E80FC4|nr:BLUF domain-containing protein [Magnetospira sp. QH-2]CCQ72525.1 putative sensor of blue-light using FAD [Magnetospira sp. QH-2]
MLYRLIYSSIANPRLRDSDLRSILRVSRRDNAAHQITGVLIFTGRGFAQFLEGPRSPIERLVNRIRVDRRNRDLQVLNTQDCEERAFADWSMGWVRPKASAGSWEGLRSAAQIRRTLTGDRAAGDVMVRACLRLLDPLTIGS